MVFILDENVDSIFENLLTMGVVESASVLIRAEEKSTITWTVIESI